MKKLNVAIIGAKFMGKAHSSSWSQVHRFFDFTAETWANWFMGKVTQEISHKRCSVRWRMSPS
jgi:predicted dehydrogenase